MCIGGGGGDAFLFKGIAFLKGLVLILFDREDRDQKANLTSKIKFGLRK